MRGYFGIGVEGLSKPMNAGNLFRSAHAFGGSFVFTVGAERRVTAIRSDTSRTAENLPWYDYPGVAELQLPHGCHLIGVELLDAAVPLPSFKHPLKAAYVFGPERSSLSAAMISRCDYLVKIPTSFCVNVGVAGAVVMYDRLLTLGKFAERPVWVEGKLTARPAHHHGDPIFRRGKKFGATDTE